MGGGPQVYHFSYHTQTVSLVPLSQKKKNFSPLIKFLLNFFSKKKKVGLSRPKLNTHEHVIHPGIIGR